ncbi:MAG TPA: M48 family metallopeptidase [Pirellulales bacterium]|jgi:STE24 endopeptidase|nr:M48 family metallopeptidase [Pirellulales bacterium]
MQSESKHELIDDARADSGAEMTLEQLAEARHYGRLELICELADKAIDLAYLAVMAFAFARALDGWLAQLIARAGLRLAAMFVVVTGLHLALSFPLSLYSGFVLEHRFGLSRQTLGRWLWHYAKRNLLVLVFGLAMFEGLYALIWWTGPNWWWIAAGAFFAVSVLLGQLVPVLILPLFYKIERIGTAPQNGSAASPEQDAKAAELARRMIRLADGTGLSIEGVYRMDLSSETAKANAMLAGLGRTRRVIMGDTLLDGFTPDEIEVVFAHEIGHHVHRHIWKLIAVGVLLSAIGFWTCDRLLSAWAGIGPGGIAYRQLPAASLPLLMLWLTFFSLLLEPLQNAISRRFERQCDRYALSRTGLRAAYISAFKKLAKLNKDDPNPNPIAVFLFHSHPPIAERLALADEQV